MEGLHGNWFFAVIGPVVFVILVRSSIFNQTNKSVDTQWSLQEVVILNVPGAGTEHATNQTIAIVQINGEIHNVNQKNSGYIYISAVHCIT